LLLSTVTELHFISAIFILIATVIPIYLSLKLKNNLLLRKLTILLSIFIFIHSFYHIAGSLGSELLAEGLLEPLSVIVLVVFGVMYLNVIKTKEERIKAG
jgi:DMSO/TMAO reductase YedYZ heme-binding membrane subunit